MATAVGRVTNSPGLDSLLAALRAMSDSGCLTFPGARRLLLPNLVADEAVRRCVLVEALPTSPPRVQTLSALPPGTVGGRDFGTETVCWDDPHCNVISGAIIRDSHFIRSPMQVEVWLLDRFDPALIPFASGKRAVPSWNLLEATFGVHVNTVLERTWQTVRNLGSRFEAAALNTAFYAGVVARQNNDWLAAQAQLQRVQSTVSIQVNWEAGWHPCALVAGGGLLLSKTYSLGEDCFGGKPLIDWGMSAQGMELRVGGRSECRKASWIDPLPYVSWALEILQEGSMHGRLAVA